MASTLYTSLNYRTVQADIAAAEFPNLSKLMASGAVQIDPNPPFKGQGGVAFNVPYFMEVVGADVVPTAATDGTRQAITSNQDVGTITEREYILGVEESAKLAVGTGQDIGSEIERQVPNYWVKRLDIALYNVLSGAFAAASGCMNSATYFVVDTGSSFAYNVVKDIMNLGAVGSNWADFKIWVMHSKQFAQALDNGLVNYVEAGAFGERLLYTGTIPTILGKQVVVDDNIVDTSGETYLLKPGALYLGFQKDFGVEFQRDASLAGGTDEYCLRAAFMPHLFGLTYGGSAKPTNATLATAGSWTLSQSTDYKLFKAIKVKFANT